MSLETNNTEHVARVKELVDFAHEAEDGDVLHQLIMTDVQTAKIDIAIWREYNNNSTVIDSVLRKRYFSCVIPECDRPSEIALSHREAKNLIRKQLEYLNTQFVIEKGTAINKLYEIESVEFNPVENYDRIEHSETVRSGNETVTNTESGSEVDTEHKTSSGENTNTQSGGATVSNSGDQTIVTDNSATAYNTNNIDTQNQKNTDNRKTDTVYNDLKNEGADSRTDDVERTHTFNDRQSREDKTYNNVSDVFDARTHGNIGVTTATAMLTEYQKYYVNYSFWEKFWSLWIDCCASPIFDTDRSAYEEEL